VRQFIGSVCLEKFQWQRLVLILALLPALLALNSCGGSSTTPATPTLTISCAATSVVVNGTVQCTQNILNLSSTLVNWQAGGVAGGNSTFGTIDTNGLYTAPQAVPTNNIVTITAIAQAQTSLTATATIQINAATAISAVTCLDSTQTPSLTVKSGTSLACTATSSANTAIPVFWQVNTITGGNAALGSISAQGNYVAPLVPPAGGTVTITAISQAVSTQTMSVPVNVTFGNRVLSGNYAFSTSGRVISGNTFFARAGSFTAGGDGALTGNVEDYNQVGQPLGAKQFVFTGTYSIGPDGRGTMEFCENISTSCTTAAATAFFSIAVISPQQAQIIEFSAPNSAAATRVGKGEMDLQNTSVFGTGTGGLAGVYSFNFSGLTSAATPQSKIGEFDADGQGSIAAGSTNNPATPGDTPGKLDINGGGEQFLSASSYSITSNGRGTATIGSSVFNFYLVSASRAKFIEADASAVTLGDAFKQQVNPSSPCSWGNSALNNAIVFETSGTGPSGGITDLVSFTGTSGVGLATSTITDGAIDENSGGTVPPPASSLSGTYSIDACGRGTLSISTHSYVFYLISPGNAVIQETTAGIVAYGTLLQPQVASFTKTSLSGSYALNLSGTNAPGIAGSEVDFVGQLTADGSGKVTSGSLDTNNFGATQTIGTNTGTYLPAPVVSATAPPGTLRATMSLTTGNFVLYQVSPTQIFALGSNSTGVASGALFKQF
jgi:hypothetical protein